MFLLGWGEKLAAGTIQKNRYYKKMGIRYFLTYFKYISLYNGIVNSTRQ